MERLSDGAIVAITSSLTTIICAWITYKQHTFGKKLEENTRVTEHTNETVKATKEAIQEIKNT